MGWHQDEQAMELEALEAMYTHQDEFNKFSNTHFSLSLSPYPDGEEENHVAVDVHFEYPESYPEELPNFSVTSQRGVDSRGLAELEKRIRQDLVKNKGTLMIFSAAQEVQEWLRLNNKPQLSMYDQMMSRANNDCSQTERREVDDADSNTSDSGEEESATYRGLAEKELCHESECATKEEFDVWAKNFRQEMIQKGLWRGFNSADGVLTGKKLFEIDASLATKDNADDAAEDHEKEKGEPMWENLSVFEEDDPSLSDD